MLYNLEWLNAGEVFPPICEEPRIIRYQQNAALFDGDHFGDPSMRSRVGVQELPVSVFRKCADKISRIIGNFEEVVSFPVLLNYQRLMSLKMADLVCGERPTVHRVVLVVVVRVPRREVDVPGVVLAVLRAGPVIRRGSCVRCLVPNYAADTSVRSGTPIQKRNNHS